MILQNLIFHFTARILCFSLFSRLGVHWFEDKRGHIIILRCLSVNSPIRTHVEESHSVIRYWRWAAIMLTVSATSHSREYRILDTAAPRQITALCDHSLCYLHLSPQMQCLVLLVTTSFATEYFFGKGWFPIIFHDFHWYRMKKTNCSLQIFGWTWWVEVTSRSWNILRTYLS